MEAKQTDFQRKGNAAIAVWLGIPTETGKSGLWYDGYELYKAGVPFSYGAEGNGLYDLRFHSDWRWLMFVVGKITQDGRFIGDEYRESIMDVVPYAVIEDVFRLVSEFVNYDILQNS